MLNGSRVACAVGFNVETVTYKNIKCAEASQSSEDS